MSPKTESGATLLRKLVYAIVGMVSWPALTILNKLRFSGVEHLSDLPRENVLFVCNHQTYFADVIALLHIFGAVKSGRRERLGLPSYLLNDVAQVDYVAAEQTMRANWMSRFFTLAGSVSIKRTWNAGSGESRKGLEISDTRRIMKALEGGWIINFPQGTTTPFAPGRKGTALIVKKSRPVVVPVVIGGFGDAFQKQSLWLRKTGVPLSVRFKEPLDIDFDANTDSILARIMDAIEQSGPPVLVR